MFPTLSGMGNDELLGHILTAMIQGGLRCIDEKKETTKTIRLPFEVIDDGDFQGEEVDENDRRRMYRIIGPSSGPVTKPDDFLDMTPCKKIAKEWMRDQKAYQWGH